ncbi:MAG: DUF6106 family protein [Lachnospiraceae bacterium]
MNDFYTEQLVKKKTSITDILAKIGLIALTGLSIFFVFLFPMVIIVPIIMIVVDVFMFKKMDVEYEYLYVNGDLDIDKIMSKSKRKRMLSVHVNEMEIIAPSGANELQAYRDTKPFNFSSLETGCKTYELITIEKGIKKRIIFEPNPTILEGMRMIAPRKVII